MAKNILSLNFKGGSGKTTISSTTASYLNNSMLIEMDTINQSDKRISSTIKNYAHLGLIKIVN